MMYYLFNTPMFPCRWLEEWPYLPGISFWQGKILDSVPQPLKFKLLPYDQYSADDHPDLPPYFLGRIPLFRQDLITAMESGGVDNLQYFDAEIYDPDVDQKRDDYKAVNIVGLVAAADMEKSNATVHPGGAILDVDFDGLVVDESKTHGFLMFRLAESCNAVLVNERLVKHLLSSGFKLFTDNEYRQSVKPAPSMNLTFLDPVKCAI